MIDRHANRTHNKVLCITYDRQKSDRNRETRGISFEEAVEFDFSTALISLDDRQDYGEARYVAVGFIKLRLHVLVFTETSNGIRVISLRKANFREMQCYAKQAH